MDMIDSQRDHDRKSLSGIIADSSTLIEGWFGSLPS
jgi:hypothetical protein